MKTNRLPNPDVLPKPKLSSGERECVEIAASKSGTFLFAPEGQEDRSTNSDRATGLLKKKAAQPLVEEPPQLPFSRHSEVSSCQMSYGDPGPELSTVSSFRTDDQFADVGKQRDSGLSATEVLKPINASMEASQKHTDSVTSIKICNGRPGTVPTQRRSLDGKGLAKPSPNVRRTTATIPSTSTQQKSPALLRRRAESATKLGRCSQLVSWHGCH
ncbi:unnamed protein product [Schistocephalus solidus]|uniref:Uncharacterized protein n=1 Tax=Schistocephalus solidus TaxID=70667 RepID=A0A183TQG6_SCHSO|nr:unnamed protein product [Schistocephalus solidus]